MAGLAVTLAVTASPSNTTTASAASHAAAAKSNCGPQPPASEEPSGTPPLAPRVLPGWARTYCTDFLGTRMPPGWSRFSGVPKGDAAGMWAPTHVRVSSGVLHLATSRDPARGNAWVSGGACLCGLPQLYGAYFVRSRLTAGGASDVELLWPKDNSWPPEVDFFESWQYPNLNTFTDHYAREDHLIQGWLQANLTKWHTWGVLWTPSKLVFVVDLGIDKWRVWGTLTNRAAIPSTRMTLDLQQQVWCSIAPACPTRPSSMLVDWVTVYAPAARSASARAR